jgi:nucleoid-associated protein EbfC
MTESQDPFGGFDLNALLQQAQQMQEQMVSAQQQLADTTVDGTVGDGLVTVTLDGTGDLVRVQIRRDSFDPAEPEDLEDLIVAAYRDAKTKTEALAVRTLGPLAGGGFPGMGAALPDRDDDEPEGPRPELPPGF